MDGGELRAFLKAVRGTRYEAVFVLMVGTGMRPSEMLALRWEDVDLETGALRVRRTLPKGWQRRLREGRDPFEETKTEAGERAVDLAPPVVAALRAHRARQGEQRLLAGSRWRDPYGLVFASSTGRPLDWDNLRARHFKPALRRAEIPQDRFRAYDLRHHADSWIMPRTRRWKAARRGLAAISLELESA
jgi:integrase